MKVIKKRFKCPVCKSKYPITIDMLRDTHSYSIGRVTTHKSFDCPVCGTTLTRTHFGLLDGDSWKRYDWEVFDGKHGYERRGEN